MLRLAFLTGVIVSLVLAVAACTSAPRDEVGESEAAAVTRVATSRVSAEVCPKGFEAFRSTFLPSVQEEICEGCHNGSEAKAPPWLVGTDEQMYLAVKNYVNFSNLGASRLHVRAGNGHDGRGGCTPEVAARVKEALEAWWAAGESTCDQTAAFRTQARRIPAGLAKDRFVSVEWDLTSVDVNLRGVKLAVEIRKFTDRAGEVQGSYLLRKPRFVADAPIPVAVEHLRILNNLKYWEGANQFEGIHAVVSPDVKTGSALAYPVLTPEAVILPEETPGGDDLVVAFEKIQKTERKTCRAMDKFRSLVMPIVAARGCENCHVPGGTFDGVANARMSLTGTPEEKCEKFLGRTWPDPNELPALVAYPLRAKFEHPQIFVGADNVLPDWTDWIEAEWR